MEPGGFAQVKDKMMNDLTSLIQEEYSEMLRPSGILSSVSAGL